MANNSYNKKEMLGIYKRFFIVLLCCFPVLVLLGLFVVHNLSNFLQILAYCAVVSIVFIIEEFLYKAKREQRERLKEEARLKKGKK